MKPTFIIDFDSTFTQVEALDILCEIALKDSPKKDQHLQEIQAITDQGMAGEINFRQSLEKRIPLLLAHRDHLPELIEVLKEKVSPSFKRNKAFFEQNKERIFIVSNGFQDFIKPVIETLGLYPGKVYANSFVYDEAGHIVGFDKNNPLSQSGGKPKLIEQMQLDGEVVVIGDGYNDYEIKQQGHADKFFAFTENVKREQVVPLADHEAPNLDDILYELNMSRAHSYPKNRIKVLLLEGVHEDAVRLFSEEGYQVEYLTTALHEDELCEKIQDVNIIGIRSKTQITRKVVESAKRLIAVGAYCIGTNQIDLEACTENGVAVFNAPYSNTRSVVELAIAEMILLIRNLPDKVAGMHNGTWQKSATNSREVRGKKLGIIGYGSIGAQLSVVAEALGMDVYFYDTIDKLALGNATKCESLEEILQLSDIITLHIDGRPENDNLIGAKEFALMKDNVIFLNLARGKVVDIPALKAAIESGKIGGTGVDVFPKEPKSNDEAFESDLMGARNTILTPHIGGSTEEAQENIGHFVPGKIMAYINTGSTYGSVNFPNVQLPNFEGAHRLLHIHKNVPNVMAQINQILAKHETNILGQHLKTNEHIGYVITDIDKAYSDAVLKELKDIEATIWFRILY
ncbi:MAG: phosphoglycerate dehydrogenase [Saprospiraceae bacterium]|nr:phosphoglycerate dehydrogenase [Saprospiraceae bacterium]